MPGPGHNLVLDGAVSDWASITVSLLSYMLPGNQEQSGQQVTLASKHKSHISRSSAQHQLFLLYHCLDDLARYWDSTGYSNCMDTFTAG